MVSPIVLSASEEELSFIAARDYGQDAPRHLAALKTVVLQRQGQFREGQRWYPYEVIELGSNSLVAGHEREFAICTLLVIEAVLTGFDSATDLGEKFANRAQDYEALPAQLREEILSAYVAASAPRS